MPALAAAAAASAAMRYQFALGITICLAVSAALFPVWWSTLREYRLARALVVLGGLAALWGLGVTWLDSSRPTSAALLQGQTLTFVSFVGTIGVLLWCRSQIGAVNTTIFFGAGALMNILLTGVNASNPWKFTLAIPAAMFVLGIALTTRRASIEITALLALATVSLASDARSMTAFLVLAAAITVAQKLVPGRKRFAGPWRIIILLVAFGIAAFYAFQGLLLDGALGEAAQQRTQAQIQTSGSLLTGGRPEIGASVALIQAQPWGYGAGVAPNSEDIWTAKAGMSTLNYDPNNGYVNRYMFGGRFEVHSVLGNLWIQFGPLGAIFSLLLLGGSAYGVAQSFSRRSVSSITVYLLLLGAWDTFFSPLGPSIRNLALLFVLAVVPISRQQHSDSASHGAPITQ